jgi:hypothetical protein
MAQTVRVQVLMPEKEARRFEDYCRERGFKKSTLIARLVREHLDHEGYGSQPALFEALSRRKKGERP